MAKQRFFGGLIWTNHALDRLDERGLTQQMAWETFRSPDHTGPGNNGSTAYQKTYGISKVTIIAKRNEKNELIVLSCWIEPPIPGTKAYHQKQAYTRYQNASFWGKFFLTLRRQLGF